MVCLLAIKNNRTNFMPFADVILITAGIIKRVVACLLQASHKT